MDSCLKIEAGYQLLNDRDLAAQVVNQPKALQADSYENESQDEQTDGAESIKRVTEREAEKAPNVQLDYFEQVSPEIINILNLRRIR